VLRLVLWREFAGGVGMTWWDRVWVVLTGLQCDVAVALVVTLPLAVWCALRRSAWEGTRARRVLFGLPVEAWFGQLFLFVSEYLFFAEFLSRFNMVAIDYLIYPTEVTTNLWESYPLVRLVLASLVAGVVLAWVSFRVVPPRVAEDGGRWWRVLGWVGAVGLAVMSLRPSWLRVGSERIVNELASNGAVSGVMAVWSRNLPYDAFYAVTGPREAVLRARVALGGEGVEFPHGEPPVLADGQQPDAAWLEAARKSLIRRIPGDTARPRLNVCVVLEESLGSEFWGSLGAKNRAGEPITMTRKMDRLAESEGLLFENLWADGNRTIRGFEGVFSGFPPLPGDSILARDRTENVETLARVLQRDGYRSLFLYGGRGTFDFIRSYTTRNGWDRLVEQGDFVNPAHTTAWGGSDEDLFHRGIEEMRSLHAAGQPFLVSFMTVSNHRPYTFPAGRIKDAANPADRRPAGAVCGLGAGGFLPAGEEGSLLEGHGFRGGGRPWGEGVWEPADTAAELSDSDGGAGSGGGSRAAEGGGAGVSA
jgi:phosphoglycerol transferase MdoB-like AlkP superfamily enzyme